MNVLVRPEERVDDLQFKGLKIIQNSQYFSFGMDAVLLARFSVPRDDDIIADLGTGTGIIPILTAGLCQAKRIVGIEIQQCMSEMASRSVSLNALDSRIEILTWDLKLVAEKFKGGEFSLVIANPPYIKAGSGIVNGKNQRAISRHEILCTLEDVISAGEYLLRNGGRFTMVHKPERLLECLDCMRAHGLEPKRMQFLYPTAEKPPSGVLLEGVKGGRPGLKIFRQIPLNESDGRMSSVAEEIYSGRGAHYFQ